MQEIDKWIRNFLQDLNYEPILTMLAGLNSGKKLRSKLLLSIANPSIQAYKICAYIELIHLASLLHDDIIDEATLRRGAKSVNAEFGAKNALMLGDILYSKVFYELSKENSKFASIISNAVVKLSIGELMDVNLSQSFNENEKLYLEMIYNKTAVLIEASARCGAVLAGFDEHAFSEYGKNLGLAFQMIDDILDIKGDEKTLGKPAMNDFKEGKTTLAYMYLYKELDEKNKIHLKNLFKKDLNLQELQWFKENLAKYQIVEQVVNLAKNYGNLALKAVEKYQNNDLNNIVENMINREF